MRTRRCLIVTAAIAVGVAQAADAPKGERYALLVGVHKYSEAKELRPLPYAENDVTELAEAFLNRGDLWYAKGENDKAIADYSDFLSRAP